MKPLVKINDLEKKFKEKKKVIMALKNISTNINKGEIVSLLGPNGAGKSTLIRILCTLSKPSKGEVYVCGVNVCEDPIFIKSKVALVPQGSNLYKNFTVFQTVRWSLRINGFKKEKDERIEKTLKILDLDKAKNRLLKTLSGGMFRRVMIANALVLNPVILILDEPTTGLDPLGRVKLWKYIKKINNELKTTIIFSTHLMEEAESLCNKIIFMKEGKIIFDGKTSDLVGNLGIPQTLIFSVKKDVDISLLGELDNMEQIAERVFTTERHNILPFLSELINSYDITNIKLIEPNLNEAFLILANED